MKAPPREVALPTLFAAVGALALYVGGVRGPDYPAQFLRGELWERAGFGVWNFTWYGGHATPSYSLLVPALSAVLGADVVTAVASVLSVYVATRLIEGLATGVGPTARLLAGSAFAVGALVNVVVGRTAFAAGLLVMLLAFWAWLEGRLAVAVGAALVGPLLSPVVGAFGAVLAAAVGIDALLDRRRDTVREAIAVLAGLLAPLLLMTLLFRDGGRFPYRGGHLVLGLVLMAFTAAAYRNRVVQLAAGMAALSSIVLFLAPNPMGGNFTRFSQYLVVPVAVLAVARAPRRWLVPAGLVAAVGVGWTGEHGLVAWRQWSGDPSDAAGFHQPLIDEVQRRNADGAPTGRVEIPFSDHHWEAYYVATEVPYARGWERQADLGRNDELYDPDLTDAEYRAWVDTNAVRWIAVPDITLDEGGQPEGALIAAGLDWLTPVWSNDDWDLYEVADYVPIVDAPAEFVSQDVETVVLRTEVADDVTVRYWYSADLRIDGGACLAPIDDSGWMTVRLPAAGEYTISAPPSALLPGASTDTCAP